MPLVYFESLQDRFCRLVYLHIFVVSNMSSPPAMETPDLSDMRRLTGPGEAPSLAPPPATLLSSR